MAHSSALRKVAAVVLAIGLFFVGVPALAASKPSRGQLPALFHLLLGQDDEPVEKPTCPKEGVCLATYRFSGAIDEDSSQKAAKWLAAAKKAGAKAILFEIDSVGGGVDPGFQLAKAIEDVGVPVHCVTDGKAASMAFFVLQSCTTRAMTKRSQLMIHEPKWGVDYGRSEQELKNGAEALRTLSRGMAEHSSGRMGMPVQRFLDHITRGQDWYMDWEDALVNHAVDNVVCSVASFRESLRQNLSLVGR